MMKDDGWVVERSVYKLYSGGEVEVRKMLSLASWLGWEQAQVFRSGFLNENSESLTVQYSACWTRYNYNK